MNYCYIVWKSFSSIVSKPKTKILHLVDNTGQKKIEQKDKQPSTKHTHKTKDRVTRTPLKNVLFIKYYFLSNIKK
jgi:hypothetical protein